MDSRKSIKQEIYDSAGGGEEGIAAVKAYEDYIRQYTDMMSGMLQDNARYHFLPRNEKISATVMGIEEDDYSEDSCSISERNNMRDMQDRAFKMGRYRQKKISDKSND